MIERPGAMAAGRNHKISFHTNQKSTKGYANEQLKQQRVQRTPNGLHQTKAPATHDGGPGAVNKPDGKEALQPMY